MKPLLAANWKMNLTLGEAKSLVNVTIKNNGRPLIADVVFCVPYVYIPIISRMVDRSCFFLGAQNMYYEDKGAFTGEISPVMLKQWNVDYVILGHSERRNYFNETDEIVVRKTKAALLYDLKPIVCVGENLEERESSNHFKKVKRQIQAIFKALEKDEIKRLIFAYEPIWAIGTGKTAEAKDAYEMHKMIRNETAENFSTEIAENLRILYGGSVNEKNIDELMAVSQINGVLVGGASLKADSFRRIVHYKPAVC